MNLVVVSLEMLLAFLLLATLFFGIKLERKLKALRQSQAGFASAVRDLDGAAQRTEAGLDALRYATENARNVLVERMDAAQAMALRLEQLTGEAETAALRAETATINAAKAASPPPPTPRPALAYDHEETVAQAYARPIRMPDPVPAPPSRLRQAAALLRGG
ncbi:MAG TPA: DUF6468 domain-containing protein [Caulobacteraceae bacterium]|jgi:hypothetical protein